MDIAKIHIRTSWAKVTWHGKKKRKRKKKKKYNENKQI